MMLRRATGEDVAAALEAQDAPVTARKKKKKKKKALPPPFDPAQEVGAIPFFFDPLGFSKFDDEEGFWTLRDYELKHGRVAMVASVGLVVQHYVQLFEFQEWATYLKVSKNSLGALSIFYGPVGFWQALGILFFMAGIEWIWCPYNQRKEAGNFGDPLGLNQYNPGMRSVELINSRFAMLSVLGIFAAELVTGKDGIQNLGLLF